MEGDRVSLFPGTIKRKVLLSGNGGPPLVGLQNTSVSGR